MKVIKVIAVVASVAVFGAATAFLVVFFTKGHTRLNKPPNIVIFLADDTGYADLQSYGHPTQEHGAVDRMATEGVRFTQWTSASSVCSPSRAAILTGRYPVRSGSYGHTFPVFSESTSGGLPRSELTIAEMLQDLGYETGLVGKWHLGMNSRNQNDGTHLPKHHGFNFVGTNLPYSLEGNCDPEVFSIPEMANTCFLYDNSTIIQQPIDLKSLTRKLLRDAKTFVESNQEKPFFLFFSFPQTHIALFCDDEFCGKSKRGLYGDNVNEMAWAVGEVLDQLEQLGIGKDTFSLFLSDNGPDNLHCPWGGSSGLLRGGKITSWEGGYRVPAIAHWPGTLPHGVVSDAVVSSLDILPTLAHIAGSPNYLAEKKIQIDGVPIKDLVPNSDETRHEDRDILFYYCGHILMAVRYKQYKIHYSTLTMGGNDVKFPDQNPSCSRYNRLMYMRYGCDGEFARTWDPPLTFDLNSDPGESFALNATDPEIGRMLLIVADLVNLHKFSIEEVEPQYDLPMSPLYRPCCIPPNCTCNYKK